MLKTKLRSFSVVALALVMSLTLVFGIKTLTKTNSAFADEVVFDLSGTEKTGSGGKVGKIKSRNAFYARGGGSPSVDSNGLRLRSSTVVVFSVDAVSNVKDLVLYNSKTSAQSVDIKIYRVSDVYYNLFDQANANGKQLQETVNADPATFADFAGKNNATLCSSSILGSGNNALVEYSNSALDAGKKSFTVVPTVNNNLDAGKYALFAEVDSNVYLTSFSLQNADTRESFEVKYYDEDGTTLLHTESVKDGDPATYSIKPEKPADDTHVYTFDKWVTEAGGSTPADLSSIKAATSVYASYTAKEIVVTNITEFNAINDINVSYGTAENEIGLPEKVFSGENGFKVVGWSWSPSYNATGLGTYIATVTSVEFDSKFFKVTAAMPSVKVIVNEIKVTGETLSQKGYTFDNSTVKGLPSVYTFGGVDFNILWGEYAAGSGTISGTLEAKTGYDVSSATIIANVEKVEKASTSINFVGKTGVVADDLSAAGFTSIGNWTYETSENNVQAGNYTYMGIKGNSCSITMYLDRPATVVVSIGGNNKGAVSFNEKSVKSNTADVVNVEEKLEPGAYTLESTPSGNNQFVRYIEINYGDSTQYRTSTDTANSGKGSTLPETAATKEGYTFIGWTADNESIVAPGTSVLESDKAAWNAAKGKSAYAGSVYSAVYAKVSYLGAGVKVSTNAIRFGFAIELSEENATLLESIATMEDLGNLYYGISAVDESKFTPIAKKSVVGNQVVFNLVINMSAQQIDLVLQSEARITINGVNMNISSEAVSAKTIAERAIADANVNDTTKNTLKSTYGIA